jgi:hypothetical protein
LGDIRTGADATISVTGEICLVGKAVLKGAESEGVVAVMISNEDGEDYI